MYLRMVTVTIILCILSLDCAITTQPTQDQTSPRANTLNDEADDIQKQLDNEARDRLKYGKSKTIWVFQYPTQFTNTNDVEPFTKPLPVSREQRRLRFNAKREIPSCCSDIGSTRQQVEKDNWSYKDQNRWFKLYPACGGRSQSPVNLPYQGLTKVRGARKTLFINYDQPPTRLTVQGNGQSVTLRGKWRRDLQPFIYGGAAHSRRYIFHSITLHWPSEHSVGGLQYPIESQALHISAEYKSYEEALNASVRDPQAFVAVASLYKYDNHTQAGLNQLLEAAKGAKYSSRNIAAKPLQYFNPPFGEYACYQGSLTTPPCEESVLWLVRARALSVTRAAAEGAHDLLASKGENGAIFYRTTQQLNDRRVFYFRN